MRTTNCIFCGGPANSKEHVFPKWLIEVMRESPYDINDMTRPIFTSGGVKEVNHDFFSFTAKIVCNPCNNVWMSTMESDIQHFFLPLAFGDAAMQPFDLDKEEQQSLAAWAWKTLMIVERAAYTDPARHVIPSEHHRYLYEHKQPNQHDTLIHAARVTIPHHQEKAALAEFDIAPFFRKAGAQQPDERVGYTAYLRFGHIGFFIAKMELPEGHSIGTTQEDPAHLPLWPTSTFTWPPPRTIERDQWVAAARKPWPFPYQINSGPTDSAL